MKKHMNLPSEIEFKRHFRKSLVGWSEAFEPARGSGTGIPDLAMIIGDKGKLLFIELKVGKIIDQELHFSEIRPAQYAWHDRFLSAGGNCCFVVGVKCDRNSWNSYVLPRMSHAEFTSCKQRGWTIPWNKTLLMVDGKGAVASYCENGKGTTASYLEKGLWVSGSIKW